MKKRLSLSRVFKQRDKLLQTIRPYTGFSITGRTLKDLTDDVYRMLPDCVSHDAVFETCRTLAGLQLDKKTAAEFAWRVAGNIELLVDAIPVIPWTRQIADEWMPIQVTRVDAATLRNNHGYLFECRTLAGSYCPGVFSQYMSRASCSAISRRVGFSKNCPYTNGLYFTNLRFWGFIEVARSAESLHFQQVDCSTALQAHNRKIIAVRTRREPCPQSFDHPCERCVVGRDVCHASIFSRQLVKKHCEFCETASYFDLDRSDTVCFLCGQSGQFAQIAGN
jgi:hypothetical protein